MAFNRFYYLTLIIIAAGLGYLSYQILLPFMLPIGWAIVFSVVFYPIYAFLLKYIKWTSVASLITLGFILLLIFGPFSYLTFLLIVELKTLLEYIEADSLEVIRNLWKHPTVARILNTLTSWFGITEADINKAIIENVSRIGDTLLGRIRKGMADIVSMTLNFVFMSFSIFFLLKDGPGFLKKIQEYLPFTDEQKERIIKQIRDIIVSTIFGGVLVAIVQGIIGGIAYSLLGVPSPVLWGLATSVASFIPLIGTVIIWGPATIYLFYQGMVLNAVVLFIIGFFGISLIDNVLKPIIIGSRTKMNMLIVFFSVIGGLKLFGLIGLVMGPLVMVLFISVIEIFRNLEQGGQNA